MSTGSGALRPRRVGAVGGVSGKTESSYGSYSSYSSSSTSPRYTMVRRQIDAILRRLLGPASLSPRLWRDGPRPEQSTADAHHRRPLLDGHAEVLAHAHRP